jgi:hypothetical protein
MRSSANWPLWVLSILGMALSGYLSLTAFNGESVKGCSVGSACDIVLSSQWARTLGMPTAVLGIPDLHGTGGDRVRETPGSALAAGMDRLALRTALQRISDNDLDDRAARSVSVLSHFAGADDGHLCTGHVATALEYDEVLVGTMADSNRSCCGRAHRAIASELHGSAGSGAVTGGSRRSRIGGASEQG